jgi:hypothetical protein
MGGDRGFEERQKVARRASRLPINPALIFAVFTFSRFISTLGRSESNPRFRFRRGVPRFHHPHRIHLAGPAADRIASIIHSARPLFSERKQPIRCRRHVGGRHVSPSEKREQEGEQTRSIASSGSPHVVGQNIRRLPNEVPEFIPPSRPSPSGEGEQRVGRVNPRRSFTHPCPILRAFPGSTSPSLGGASP